MSLTKRNESVEECWTGFLSTGDLRKRERLIEHYLYLVKIAIGRLLYTLPSYIDREDLESYGIIGLLQALERFRPERGLKFETYALSRIRGAVIDYLRSLDPMTRGQRKTFKKVMETWQKLQKEKGRDPTLEEVSGDMNITVEEVSWVIERYKSSILFSLEQENNEDGRLLGDDLPDETPRFNPQEILENRELMEFLGQAIDDLPERDRLCVALYYYEGLTLKEIGSILEVGESRVSQILSRSLLKLRSKMNEWKGPGDE
ncbi:MAG TPA: FliA/WhiG family RNA polymerase sigma factor [Atribacteraceae bacterium]|nr:FliA/WhiG family RNA polymerase sigma factor [Atribacteraceae bacterium]